MWKCLQAPPWLEKSGHVHELYPLSCRQRWYWREFMSDPWVISTLLKMPKPSQCNTTYWQMSSTQCGEHIEMLLFQLVSWPSQSVGLSEFISTIPLTFTPPGECKYDDCYDFLFFLHSSFNDIIITSSWHHSDVVIALLSHCYCIIIAPPSHHHNTTMTSFLHHLLHSSLWHHYDIIMYH